MTGGINILQGVIQDVAVSIECLRVSVVWYYTVRADEPPYGRIVVPGIVVIQACAVKPLAREFLVRVQRASLISGQTIEMNVVPTLRSL